MFKVIVDYVKTKSVTTFLNNHIVVDYQKIVAEDVVFVTAKETFWDNGTTSWDVNGGVPLTYWDIVI